MIVFDLECAGAGHRFEGWFASSQDFEAQAGRGLVACPQCGSIDVTKAPMAPRLGRKGNQVAAPPQVATPPKGVPTEVLKALAAVQAEALKDSRWVGGDFAEVSRAIHYGERESEIVHGEATAAEARDLIDEGVGVMPLLFPVVPDDALN